MKRSLTETRGKDILFLGTLAGWQFVVQTELAVAVIAGQRPVLGCGALLVLAYAVVHVFGFRACAETPVFEEYVVEGRGAAGGFGGIEGDDGAVGEAGAFAEGGWGYSM